GMSAEPALALERVRAAVAGRTIVREISLAVTSGEMLALVGPSGAGKTTIARLAAGLIAPAAGEVFWDGERIARFSSRAFRASRPRTQMIYQDPDRSLDPSMRVAEAVCEGLELQTRPPWRQRLAWRRRQAAPWLERVGLDLSLAARWPGEFSGGQRQRVAIARALAVRPRLLVADEPVASLDPPVAAQVLALLSSLQRADGIACLLISHQIAQAAQCADRLAVLAADPAGATIVECGATAALLSAPRHPLTRALLDALPPWPPPAARAAQR
ncbi:MAG: ABC transporter ATP-binding protein, partial [Terriglobales bacterium]